MNFAVPEDLEGRLWFMTGAEYIPSQEKIADEQKAFYVPSTVQGTLELLVKILFTSFASHITDKIVISHQPFYSLWNVNSI